MFQIFMFESVLKISEHDCNAHIAHVEIFHVLKTVKKHAETSMKLSIIIQIFQGSLDLLEIIGKRIQMIESPE